MDVVPGTGIDIVGIEFLLRPLIGVAGKEEFPGAAERKVGCVFRWRNPGVGERLGVGLQGLGGGIGDEGGVGLLLVDAEDGLVFPDVVA